MPARLLNSAYLSNLTAAIKNATKKKAKKLAIVEIHTTTDIILTLSTSDDFVERAWLLIKILLFLHLYLS